MTFLPYRTFSPKAPNFLATVLSGSASSGKLSLYLARNFSWEARESGLTPKTTAPVFLIFAWVSRKAHASLVHPGVSSFG